MTLCHREYLFALQQITVEALISRHHQDTKKVSVTGVGHLREYKNTEFVYGSWEKQGFVKVAISRAAPLTRVSVRRVSTDCIVQFIIPGCYLWHWRSWCQGRWTYGWNEQVKIILINYTFIIIILCHFISSIWYQWAAMMQLATNAIYGLLYVAKYLTQIKMFCTSFHTYMYGTVKPKYSQPFIIYTLDSYGSWKTWKVM